MKTPFASYLIAVLLILPLAAPSSAAAAASCCAPEPAPVASPPCCPPPSETESPADRDPPPLSTRSLYQLEATWTNDAGERVTLAQLRGRPVVLAMFFASCEYACPILVHDLQRIRDGLPATVRAKVEFVLVSFDHVRDTPAALKAYRERAGLEEDRWTLLHGDPDVVQELAMLLGVKFKEGARGQYAHSNLVTVLDAEGEIVHQRSGLQGEVATAIHAVTVAAN